MALALFKKSQPAQPARDLLRTHLAEVQSLQHKRIALSAHVDAARLDCDRAAAADARVKALSDSLDLSLANLRYSGESTTDLPTLRQQLSAAQSEASKAASVGRPAAIALTRYQADMQQLSAQAQQLSTHTPLLLRDALLETMQERRPRFEAAEAELRAALNSVLEPAVAIDSLAGSLGQSPIGAASLYADLVVPRPFASREIITDLGTQLEAGKALALAHEAHALAWKQTETAGAKLANQLLAGEAID